MIAILASILKSSEDQSYITELYCRHERLMFSAARWYADDPRDCEDIVQESITKLIDKIDYFRGLDSCVLSAYLVSTVRNTAINHQNRQTARRQRTRPLDETVSASPDFCDPVELLDQKGQLALIRSKLSAEEWFLLEGHFILGYSYEELAEKLGCNAGSIRMKASRARRKALPIIEESRGDENG